MSDPAYFRAYGDGLWLPRTDDAIDAVIRHGTRPADEALTPSAPAGEWLDLEQLLARFKETDATKARRYWLNSFTQVSETGHPSDEEARP